MESVWDYPRPPALVPDERRVRIEHAGVVIAVTTRALRILETSHPPTFYLPPEDVARELLALSPGRGSRCEFKGVAAYCDLLVPGAAPVRRAAWTYAEPVATYAALRDHLAFYPSRVDACFVGDERVVAQDGDFYGGWITSDVTGPFKGAPGTLGW
jgi:uncharacterized protein (DUF427 family)